MFGSTSRLPSNPTSSPNLLLPDVLCFLVIKEKEREKHTQLVQVFFVTSKNYSLQDQDLLHAAAGERVGAGKQGLECEQNVEVDHRKKFFRHFCWDSNPGPFDHRVQRSTTELFSAPAPPSGVIDLNKFIIESISLSTDNNIIFWGASNK